VNQPTPAIVPQSAVRRLPRLALLLLCVAYVLPGFLGRDPWKNADVTAFGYMLELAGGQSSWLQPQLAGLPVETDSLLPYWLGAWAIHLAPAWVAPDFAVRVPFALLLALTLIATWYGVYYLARSPQAQPVAFAFGGEAQTPDYARAMADGGLLALIASLGLAQLSHETTPALAQVCATAVTFYAMAAMPYRTAVPSMALLGGLAALVLSGAPAMATLLGAGSALLYLLGTTSEADERVRLRYCAAGIAAATLLVAALAWMLELWRWRIALPPLIGQDSLATWKSIGRLLLWFTWPAWPLALWTLWRWRRQLSLRAPGRHVMLPIWFAAVAIGSAVFTQPADRTLLLGLPALATLAAFALPTLRRSVAALIDWFTLLFFTGCSVFIWVIWIAMQTGVPRQPAANVAKLAPGFEPSFSWLAFGVALVATLTWGWLVKWRVGRHRTAIWRSLVLPAGGAALCWLLLMTLWLPLLDFARSYAPQVQRVSAIIGRPVCVEIYGLSRAQIAAFNFHGKLNLMPATSRAQCPWLMVDADARGTLPKSVNLRQWSLQATVRRPTDSNEDVMLYRRSGN
jgi:4-amino-4-deoxy-L-arabinose transferase-like glycosyltransferase